MYIAPTWIRDNVLGGGVEGSGCGEGDNLVDAVGHPDHLTNGIASWMQVILARWPGAPDSNRYLLIMHWGKMFDFNKSVL